jgi:hypothetical protein
MDGLQVRGRTTGPRGRVCSAAPITTYDDMSTEKALVRPAVGECRPRYPDSHDVRKAHMVNPLVDITTVIGARVGRVETAGMTRPRASFRGPPVSARSPVSLAAAGRIAGAGATLQAGSGNSRLVRVSRVSHGSSGRFPADSVFHSAVRSGPGTAYPGICRHKCGPIRPMAPSRHSSHLNTSHYQLPTGLQQVQELPFVDVQTSLQVARRLHRRPENWSGEL